MFNRSLTEKSSYLIYVSIQIFIIILAHGLGHWQNHLIAFMLFFSAIYQIFLSRKNIAVFMLYLIYGYFIYSVIVGEYIGLTGAGMPNQFHKPEQLYTKMLVLLAIFNAGISYFSFSYKPGNFSDYSLGTNNPLISFSSVVLAVSILLFGLDRSATDGYQVRISEAFEYSVLVLLIGFAFSEKNSFWTYGLMLLAIIFVIEDLRFGGRITSVRILLVLALMCFYRFLNAKRMIILTFIGIVMMAFVGAFRSGGGVGYGGLQFVLVEMASKLFVFDTVVYAYYASITHLMLLGTVDFVFIMQSFLSMLAYLPSFGLDVDQSFQLTKIALQKGFWNAGGGIAPSYLYFWLGYVGVFLGGFAIAWVYKFFHHKTGFGKIIFVALVSSFPRWFLYGVWIVPRTVILMLIAYLIYRLLFRLVSKPQAVGVKM